MNPLIIIIAATTSALIVRKIFNSKNPPRKSQPPQYLVIHPDREHVPDDLGEWSGVNIKKYLSKWLNFFLNRFSTSSSHSATPSTVPDNDKRRVPPPSVIIMNILNYFEWPLYLLGIFLIIWMAVDSVLPLFLSNDLLLNYSRFARPILNIISPAIVGYWTNYLAIKMLFHPRRKNLLWQGLILARKDELVENISQGIIDRLISPEIVSKYLHESSLIKDFVNHTVDSISTVVNNPEFRKETKDLVHGFVKELATSLETRKTVSKWVKRKIDQWTGSTLGEKIFEWLKPFWGPKVRQQVLNALPEIPNALEGVLNHIDSQLNKIPPFIEKKGEKIEEQLTTLIVNGLRSLDLKSIIKKQLSTMNERELEDMLTHPVSRELRFIMTSGGIFGFIVGLAVSFNWVRGVIVGLGILLFALYFISVDSTEEKKEHAAKSNHGNKKTMRSKSKGKKKRKS